LTTRASVVIVVCIPPRGYDNDSFHDTDKSRKKHSPWDDWNAYIVNKKSVDLELVVIVSQGFSEAKTTSLFRKKLDLLPANSFAKIELMQPELFKLNNRFQVTFFEGNTLFEKTFLFKENTIKESALRMIPELKKRGILPYV
jgi:hypothetical protein